MSDFLINLSIYISIIFSPEFLFLMSLFAISVSFIYLNIKRIHYRELLTVNSPNNIKGVTMILLSIIISICLALLIKSIYQIPRPVNMLILENGYTFPSGHAAVAVSICSTAIFLLFKYFKNHIHYLNYLHSILFILTALLISGTRVVLQVHRPIDIFFGILLGLFSSFISIKIYYKTMLYIDKKIY